MDEGKKKTLIILVILGAIGFGAFLVGRDLLFHMKVGERMKDLNRFATAEQILALPDQVKEDAAHYKVPTEGMSVDLAIDGRIQGGDVIFYYVVVTVHQGTKTWHEEARIESQASLLQAETRERLEKAGVKFTGKLG